LPRAAGEFQLDAAFARYRLAGYNPVTIERCTQQLLTEKANLGSLTAAARDRVARALADKRLFVCDYSMLATLTSSKIGGLLFCDL
jgi:predicted DNA-binding protein (UPF0251 family)